MEGKMFVFYSKTKAEFIAAGLPATYTNHIVLIKGDAQGNGSCIYTHGMYFANFTEFLAAINYVKGISVNGQSYNAAAGGGYVAFEATDPSTIEVNVGQNGVKIGLTTEFINKVNNTATNLGTKDDAADKDGSAFARIANLAALVSDLTGGSTESIEGQINTAIESLRDEISGGLPEEFEGETFASFADVSQYLHETVIPSINTNTTNIQTNTEAIAKLNGNDTVDGSVDKKIKDAINDFASKATDNGTIDTFKELVDYVAGVDGSATLATAIAQINTNKGAIETLNGDESTTGSVDKKVKEAIDAEVARANGAYATTAQGAKADTAYQKPSTGIPATDMATAVQTSLGKADAAAPQATTYTKAEVDAMWGWIEL